MSRALPITGATQYPTVRVRRLDRFGSRREDSDVAAGQANEEVTIRQGHTPAFEVVVWTDRHRSVAAELDLQLSSSERIDLMVLTSAWSNGSATNVLSTPVGVALDSSRCSSTENGPSMLINVE